MGQTQDPEGFKRGCRRYCEATLLGWTVYRVTGEIVRAWEECAINLLVRVFLARCVPLSPVKGAASATDRAPND